MKPYKILLPLSGLVFAFLVTLTVENRLPGFRWILTLSAMVILLLACLTFAKMVSTGRSLTSRLVGLIVETRRETPDERLENLLNQEAAPDNLEALMKHLTERSKAYEATKVESPKVAPPDPHRSQDSLVY